MASLEGTTGCLTPSLLPPAVQESAFRQAEGTPGNEETHSTGITVLHQGDHPSPPF